MDSLIETIATWPWDVWIGIASWYTFVGILVLWNWTPAWFKRAGLRPWTLVVLLVHLLIAAQVWPYLAIRRLVRWARARGVEQRNIEATAEFKTNGPIGKYYLQPDGGVISAKSNNVLVYKIHVYGKIHFYGDEDAKPPTEARTPEKSAPYVLDTSREIRELRERVEKLEQDGAGN